MENLVYIPFLVLMILFALLYSKGKKQYASFVNALDKKNTASRTLCRWAFP